MVKKKVRYNIADNNKLDYVKLYQLREEQDKSVEFDIDVSVLDGILTSDRYARDTSEGKYWNIFADKLSVGIPDVHDDIDIKRVFKLNGGDHYFL